MIKRHIQSKIDKWIQDGNNALLVTGARQVGKTYSILEFGRLHYENVAYFNFETIQS